MSRCQAKARLIDPYAKALAGTFQRSDDGVIRPPKCVIVDDHFNWEGDRHLRRPLSETVIYEMHVRGFTRHESSGAEHPGTYLGVIEKIPYLKSLGVTAVELMPVHEFPIRDIHGNQLQRPNYWGYDPLAFFAPHRGYSASDKPGGQVDEFKTMVKALHQAGIEVILDVVFNHTCEGNELGPVLSFKGLENHVYYMMANGGSCYKNYSGCGNTVNGNHPIVREMIFHCLRHWVHNYHIDGFRFDLASILSRDRNGHLVPNPPLVEAIAEDPLLADTKIIAEAWDAGVVSEMLSRAGSAASRPDGLEDRFGLHDVAQGSDACHLDVDAVAGLQVVRRFLLVARAGRRAGVRQARAAALSLRARASTEPPWPSAHSPTASTTSCRRRSARSAATTAVVPTPRRSPPARRRSTAARRAATPGCTRSPSCSGDRCCPSIPTAASPRRSRRWPSSTSRSASAAPGASRPAPSTRSSGRRSGCTR